MCNHSKIFNIRSKPADLNHYTFPDGRAGEGYVPTIAGLGGGDYIELNVCVECGVLIGFPTGKDFDEAFKDWLPNTISTFCDYLYKNWKEITGTETPTSELPDAVIDLLWEAALDEDHFARAWKSYVEE